MRLLTYSEWACALRAKLSGGAAARARERRGCIAIDGAGGSGKSTIARALAGVAPEVQVVALDDFYRPSHERHPGPSSQRAIAADYDLERLVREVLAPLASGQPASYRRYDWQSDRVGSERITVMQPVVLLEGVYATSAALLPFVDAAVWVDCPRALRLARGLARDGAGARNRWEGDWMPGEDLYITIERARERAAFVCDGSRDDLAERIALIHEK